MKLNKNLKNNKMRKVQLAKPLRGYVCDRVWGREVSMNFFLVMIF